MIVSKDIVILHVIDDEKFMSFCEETFDLNGLKNLYTTSDNFNKEILRSEIDCIVIHYLDFKKAAVLNNVNKKIKIIWFFWGRDAFLLGKFYTKFLQQKTKSLYLKLAFERDVLEGIRGFLKLYFPILMDFFGHNKEIIKALNKIDVIVPVMPNDFFLLKKNYKIGAQMFHLNYVNPSLNNFSMENTPKGSNILLGNSASYSNNHIEIIDILSKQNLGNRRIIIPLSYGDNQYASYIEDYAKRILDSRALCLRRFMPLTEYISLIEKCSIVIMNHERQQAVGNIVPLLALGAHVYLNEKSSLYLFLKEKGFCVSEINKDIEIRELNENEIRINKKLSFDFFGKEIQQRKVSELLKTVIKSYDH